MNYIYPKAENTADCSTNVRPGISRPGLLVLALLICGAGFTATTALADYPNYGPPPTGPYHPAPAGMESFQLMPPYTTANPFDIASLQAISRGFDLFSEEDFDGNGRTCSTCHISDANFNISIEDFDALSDADKALVRGGTNPHLENLEAVNEMVLFNINQSAGPGTEGDIATPEGPFRSSMAIGGIGFTVLNDHMCLEPGGPGVIPQDNSGIFGEYSPQGTPCYFGSGQPSNGPPNARAVDDGIRDMMIGWSGEGSLDAPFPFWNGASHSTTDCDGIIADFASSRGSLRDLQLALATFALAAVKTHFPISQNRQPGVDFRCPTAAELLDMAAFQTWLGRRFELDITQLEFSSDLAEEGLYKFSSREASCVGCHVNGGGSDTQGRVKSGDVPFLDMDTGAPDFKSEPEVLYPIGTNKTSRNGSALLEDDLLPQFSSFAFPNDKGDHRQRGSSVIPFSERQGGFNVQSVIEAVRNKQFFHNNGVVGTIEDAIDFYFTRNFHCPQERFDEDTGGFEFDNIPAAFQVPECAGFSDSQGGGAIGGDFRVEHRNVFVNNGVDPAQNYDVEWQLTGPEARDKLGGDDGVNAMGWFLRNLATIYAIADCERYVDEMIDRSNAGLPTGLPADNCRFALNDSIRILAGAPVFQGPFIPVAQANISRNMRNALKRLDWAERAWSGKRKVRSLKRLRDHLAYTRNMIATTPELP